MPAPHPVPLRSTGHHRPYEQGRIKLGMKVPSKSGKGDGMKPQAIPWFRFCSKDRAALVQLSRCTCGHAHEEHRADHQAKKRMECTVDGCTCVRSDGGPVKPWTNGANRDAWQVTTLKTRIRVVLPDEPFGDGPWYEDWDGGTCNRRCDGVWCTISANTSAETADKVQVPCFCTDRLTCKPKVRLNVVLPDLDPLVGFWRLETSSDHALREMPAAVDLIRQAMGVTGLAFGFLEITEREQRRWDDRNQRWHMAYFTVPVISPAASFDAILAGAGRAAALGPAGARAALGPGPAVSPFDPDDEDEDGLEPWDDDAAGDDRYDRDVIEDAEIVEPDEMDGFDDIPRPQKPADAAEEKALRDRLIKRIHARGSHSDRAVYEAIIGDISDGRARSSKDLTLTELERLDARTEAWAKGEIRCWLDEDGELRTEVPG